MSMFVLVVFRQVWERTASIEKSAINRTYEQAEMRNQTHTETPMALSTATNTYPYGHLTNSVSVCTLCLVLYDRQHPQFPWRVVLGAFLRA